MKTTFTETGTDYITLAMAKEWLQVDDDTENATIQRLIKSTRKHLENTLGISIVDKTVSIQVDGVWFPYMLPYGPVKAVSTLKFDDIEYSENTDVLKTDYVYRPETLIKNQLTATYTTGFTTIPEDLTQLMLDMLRIFYDSRGITEIKIPSHIQQVMQNYNRNLFI